MKNKTKFIIAMPILLSTMHIQSMNMNMLRNFFNTFNFFNKSSNDLNNELDKNNMANFTAYSKKWEGLAADWKNQVVSKMNL